MDDVGKMANVTVVRTNETEAQNPVEAAREIRSRLGDLVRDACRVEGLEHGSRDWEIAVGHLTRALNGSMMRAIEAAPLRYGR